MDKHYKHEFATTLRVDNDIVKLIEVLQGIVATKLKKEIALYFDELSFNEIQDEIAGSIYLKREETAEEKNKRLQDIEQRKVGFAHFAYKELNDEQKQEFIKRILNGDLR